MYQGGVVSEAFTKRSRDARVGDGVQLVPPGSEHMGCRAVRRRRGGAQCLRPAVFLLGSFPICGHHHPVRAVRQRPPPECLRVALVKRCPICAGYVWQLAKHDGIHDGLCSLCGWYTQGEPGGPVWPSLEEIGA